MSGKVNARGARISGYSHLINMITYKGTVSRELGWVLICINRKLSGFIYIKRCHFQTELHSIFHELEGFNGTIFLVNLSRKTFHAYSTTFRCQGLKKNFIGMYRYVEILGRKFPAANFFCIRWKVHKDSFFNVKKSCRIPCYSPFLIWDGEKKTFNEF